MSCARYVVISSYSAIVIEEIKTCLNRCRHIGDLLFKTRKKFSFEVFFSSESRPVSVPLKLVR